MARAEKEIKGQTPILRVGTKFGIGYPSARAVVKYLDKKGITFSFDGNPYTETLAGFAEKLGKSYFIYSL